jgi:ABC-2 type transport system permease protein
MFRSIFTKTLRGYRVPILAWGIGLGLIIYAYYATILSQLAGSSAAQLQQIANQFSFFGETARADTPGGYITYKIMGSVPLVLGIWAVLTGARMTRGEEESGALDILLSTPQSRLSIVLQKVLAMAAAAGLMSLLTGLLILAGMASAHANAPKLDVTVDPGNALMAAFNAGILVFFFGALALLLAQLMSRGAAAGLAGGLMAFFYVLEGSGRSIQGASGVRPFSPFYYYDQSLPLVPGHGMNWGAFALLVALSVVLVVAAVPLFLRRDIGRSVLADTTFGRTEARHARPAGQVLAAASRDVWLRGVGVQAFRRQAVALFWWTLALAAFAGFMVVIAKTAEKQIQQLVGNNPTFQKIFSGADIGTNSGFLSVIVFSYLPVLLPIFSAMVAYRWASDLDKGRLELTLSTPQSRWRVILERYGAVVAATIVVTLGIWLAILLFAQLGGFSLDMGRVAVASLGLLPLGLIAASVMFALAGLVPPAAVIGVLAAYIGVAFVADLLRSLLNLPDWALNLSIFHQYGTPVLSGPNWGGLVGMLVAAAALLAVGGWQFTARDLDRGVITE